MRVSVWVSVYVSLWVHVNKKKKSGVFFLLTYTLTHTPHTYTLVYIYFYIWTTNYIFLTGYFLYVSYLDPGVFDRLFSKPLKKKCIHQAAQLGCHTLKKIKTMHTIHTILNKTLLH